MDVNGNKLRELLDMETATRLLMDYYRAETDGIKVVSDGSVRFVDNKYKEMYERAEKKYVKVSGIREQIIKEIEDCVFGEEKRVRRELLTEGDEKTDKQD